MRIFFKRVRFSIEDFFKDSLEITMSTNAFEEKYHLFAQIAAFTATGDTTALRESLKKALDAKLSISELRDALVQLYAYCGFPRSLTALSVLLSLVKERKTEGIKDVEGPKRKPRPAPEKLNAVGTAVQTRLVGAPVKGALFDFAPDIDAYLKEHLFGDIFSSGILDDKTREVLTISALAALPAPAQLTSHIAIGMNVGLTEEATKEITKALRDIRYDSAASLLENSLQSLTK